MSSPMKAPPKQIFLAALLGLAALSSSAAARPEEKYTIHAFKKITLSDRFYSEGANC